jgi:hypothetical protein
MTLPNFLVVGAAKSGTTSLYHYLNNHHDVYLTPRKETNFFAYIDSKPVVKGWGKPPEMILNSITAIEEYGQQFESIGTQKAIGEVSPLYLYSSEAPKNIHRLIPEAKIIAILRNPVDRAFSHYMHLVRDHREPIDTFREAIEAERERMGQGWTWEYYYTDMGFYFLQLTRYYELFDRSQIQVFLYDDLLVDAKQLISDLLEFLDVDSQIEVDTSFAHNPSGVPRSRALHKLLSEPGAIKNQVRRIVPKGIRSSVAQMLWEQNLKKSAVGAEMRLALQLLYREDIHKLEALIERNLHHWLV